MKDSRIVTEGLSVFCIYQHIRKKKKAILYADTKKEHKFVVTGSPLVCFLIIWGGRVNGKK